MVSMIRTVIGRAIVVEGRSTSTSTIRMWQTIEFERGFSAQNRTKTPACSKLSVARLELSMRLSLSWRKKGVGLTKRFDILREAAVVFSTMPLEGASNKYWNERARYFVLGSDDSVLSQLYSSSCCIVCEIAKASCYRLLPKLR